MDRQEEKKEFKSYQIIIANIIERHLFKLKTKSILKKYHFLYIQNY